jgi:hypothetical protein
MNILTRWLLPISMMGIGIAVLMGAILPDLPGLSSLRVMVGLVAILLGVHRFAAVRLARPQGDSRRRYGGEAPRPWERKP